MEEYALPPRRSVAARRGGSAPATGAVGTVPGADDSLTGGSNPWGHGLAGPLSVKCSKHTSDYTGYIEST
jgi:hypothetical protein